MEPSKPISQMTDAEILDHIKALRARREMRANEVKVVKTAPRKPKEDDSITLMLRDILADELK